ncbi:hypothetical protein [Caballeronia sp. INDeC2]|uniref:hypothetical protein n=1 Tax=Caballeronia sp. INDeC2 TaxID=2921747 RepID=UPI002029326E|nr:hypothetical protein [Caballeronia sp. INDeC2]
MSEWQPIETAPEGEDVMTKIDDSFGPRNEQSLKRRGHLWWCPDDSMYVYYTPTHWKPMQTAQSGEEKRDG